MHDCCKPDPSSRWLALVPAVVAGAFGCAWLADWGGPSGPPFARSLSSQHAWTLAIALVAMVLACWRGQSLGWWALRLAGVGSGLSAGRRWCLAAGAGACLVVAAAGLHWAHKLHQVPGLPTALAPAARNVAMGLRSLGWQPVTPSFTSEVLRWPACLLLAWLIYRAAHGRLNPAAQAAWSVAVLFAMALGFWASRDKGPLLVAAVAGVCLAAAAVRLLLWPRSRSKWVASAGALVVLIAGSLAILWLLPLLAPAERVAAWRKPFTSSLEYLAEITWFLQAAGWRGFGGGQTPWCGYTGALLDRCLGLPIATHSDLTLAAIAGLWGAPVAWLIAACVAAALLALMWLAARPRQTMGGIDLGGLAATAGGLYALLMLAQWATTVLGNVGLIPLTGVSLPYVSWGRAGLLSLGLATALVWPASRQPSTQGPNTLSRLWLHVVWVSSVFVLLVMLALAVGLVQRYQAAAPDRTVSGRVNPWLPVPACLKAADGGNFSANGAPCLSEPAMAHHALPKDLALINNLTRLTQTQALDDPLTKRGLLIPRRQGVSLTLLAGLQERAQTLTECLTGMLPGADGRCSQLVSPPLRDAASQRYEGAAARSVSLVTLRLSDGALLAAAHARSLCSTLQMAGQPPGPGCLPTAAVQLARAGRQDHQALRAQDMISSTVKPVLAESTLRSNAAINRAALAQALVRSDTAYFIDQLLCWNRPQAAPCTGLAQLQQVADSLQLGEPLPLWSATMPSHAATLPGLDLKVPHWPPRGPASVVARERAAAQACSQRPADQRWRACSGEHLAATLAPLWGQGDARSHPLAVAAIYLQLAAAAKGAAKAPAPHLWAGHAPEDRPLGFSTAGARFIVSALRDVPLRGTAAASCTSALGSKGCAGRGWAMKTGTSLFPHHTLTAQARAQACAQVHRAGGPAREQVACALYPMKWAVLLEDLGQPDARVTVVLAERNWSARSGLVDAGDDRGPNVAAQAAVLLHADRH